MNSEFVKKLLNNLALLRFVKKFTADNLQEDNKLAEKFGVKTTKQSISLLDNTATKLFVTDCNFEGEEHSRYKLEQLASAMDVVGKKGELIITKKNNNELIIQVGNSCMVVSPLPKEDTPIKE